VSSLLVPGRKFRSDFVWRDARVVVEVEGGIFGNVRGRHATGAGMTRDAKKYNALALEGWTVLRVTPPQIRSGLALKWIERALCEPASTKDGAQ
jgi:very-short-patch-repair endonuclease